MRIESPILGWVSNHERSINVWRVEMKYINIIEANLVISQYSVHNKMSNLEILICSALRSNTVTQCFQKAKTSVEGTRYAVVVY